MTIKHSSFLLPCQSVLPIVFRWYWHFREEDLWRQRISSIATFFCHRGCALVGFFLFLQTKHCSVRPPAYHEVPGSCHGTEEFHSRIHIPCINEKKKSYLTLVSFRWRCGLIEETVFFAGNEQGKETVRFLRKMRTDIGFAFFACFGPFFLSSCHGVRKGKRFTCQSRKTHPQFLCLSQQRN